MPQPLRSRHQPLFPVSNPCLSPVLSDRAMSGCRCKRAGTPWLKRSIPGDVFKVGKALFPHAFAQDIMVFKRKSRLFCCAKPAAMPSQKTLPTFLKIITQRKTQCSLILLLVNDQSIPVDMAKYQSPMVIFFRRRNTVAYRDVAMRGQAKIPWAVSFFQCPEIQPGSR